MALPTDSNDTFLREVDENLRRDQFQDFFKKNGKWIAAAVVLFLAAAGGWICWQEHAIEHAAEQSEQLTGASPTSAAGKQDSPAAARQIWRRAHSEAVRASAMLTDAALALEQNNRSAAIAKYREIVDDKGLPKSTAMSARSA